MMFGGGGGGSPTPPKFTNYLRAIIQQNRVLKKSFFQVP